MVGLQQYVVCKEGSNEFSLLEKLVGLQLDLYWPVDRLKFSLLEKLVGLQQCGEVIQVQSEFSLLAKSPSPQQGKAYKTADGKSNLQADLGEIIPAEERLDHQLKGLL